jgi:hypothetical protein
MSRWLPTAALIGALVLSAVAGCGSSPTTGKGGNQTSGSGPASTGKPSESGHDTAKTSARTHDPG